MDVDGACPVCGDYAIWDFAGKTAGVTCRKCRRKYIVDINNKVIAVEDL